MPIDSKEMPINPREAPSDTKAVIKEDAVLVESPSANPVVNPVPSSTATSAQPQGLKRVKVLQQTSKATLDRTQKKFESTVSFCARHWITLLIIAAAIGVPFIYACRTHTAEPNQWMLVVKDGEMRRAGVGITHITAFGDQVVTFPATLNKVPFKAHQVTKEKQGVEVSGFIVWVVNRIDDGPFKAYKHLGGLTKQGLHDANQNLADMAESIIRSQVAKLTIEDVITRREAIRDAVRESMQEVIKGWGVWLETVEVTDVRVSSKTLFNNLQTEFREEQRRISEEAKISARQQIDTSRVESNLEVQKAEALADTAAAVLRARESLKVKEEEAKLAKRRHELKVLEMEQDLKMELIKIQHEQQHLEEAHENSVKDLARQKELKMQEAEIQAAVNARVLEASLARTKQKADLEASILREKIVIEGNMTNVNLRKAALDALVNIYRELPIQNVDVKHVNFAGSMFDGEKMRGAGVAGLGSLMPTLAAAVQGLSEVQDETGKIPRSSTVQGLSEVSNETGKFPTSVPRNGTGMQSQQTPEH